MNFAPSFGSSATRTARPTGLIQAEKDKVANCFTIANTVEEGLKLSLNHPLTREIPALVLGEKAFVKRCTGKGCLYKVQDGSAVVRRAQAEKIMLDGGKHFEVLRRVDVEVSQYALVHVFVGMSAGVPLDHPLEPLWSGVMGGRMISRGESECLVEMKKGDTLNIFYPNGSVAVVTYDGLGDLLGKRPRRTSLDAALKLRLDMIDRGFDAASSKTEEARRQGQQDRMFHELAAMLRHVRLYPEFRKEIIRKVGEHAKAVGGKLTKPVLGHFASSLRLIGESTLYWWMGHDVAGPTLAAQLASATESGRGKPAEERARKAARADHDRAARAEMKGPPRSDDSKGHKSKSKKH